MITKSIIRAAAYKTIAFKGMFRPKGGNHVLDAHGFEEKMYNQWTPIDHFKFSISLFEKLASHVESKDFYWEPQSQRLLDHINNFKGTICIKCPWVFCNMLTPFDVSKNLTHRFDVQLKKY